MPIVKPFGPEIYFGKLPTDVNETLYNICINAQNDLSKRQNHMLAGLIDKEFDVLPEAKKEVLPVITKFALDYLNSIEGFFKSNIPVHKRDLVCDSFWCNVQKPNEYNPVHNHRVYDIVVVCYPKVEITNQSQYITNNNISPGSIIFHYGENFKLFNTATYSYVPQTGDIIIFPACLKHETYPIYGANDIRISTSANFKFSEYFNI